MRVQMADIRIVTVNARVTMEPMRNRLFSGGTVTEDNGHAHAIGNRLGNVGRELRHA